MGVTIKDVANAAGTSIASVSRYINGQGIKENTKLKIEKAISDLNYEINVNAKGLKTNKSMIIGVVIPSLTHIYDISIVKGIQNCIVKQGYNMLINDTDNIVENEAKVLDFLYNKKVDGVIFDPVSNNIDGLKKFIENDIPVVMIDQKIDDLNVSSVLCDNINAVYQSVEHLIKKGHTKISIVLGPGELFTAKERLTGYLRAMEDYGLAVDEKFIKYGDYLMKSGYDKMIELLDEDDAPTAVIVTNYDMTKGAILAINERNLMIPDDISFIGYDDFDLTQLYKPKLTIVMQPMIEMGEKAAELLLKQMKCKSDDNNKIYRLKTDFIINDSVKKL
jgi:LacI family transcriptional regulator